MSELREIVAKNIADLRVRSGMTQLMLAERLNYSDKAVSKWERAESVPDVFMLKTVADIFGVTVDYLLTEDHSAEDEHRREISLVVRRNRLMISFLATMLVWLISTVSFVIMNLVIPDAALPSWLVFIYSVPVSSVVILIFNSIWGRPKLNYAVITVFSWSILISLHITFLVLTVYNIWIIYLIGIPIQVIIFLWSGINNPEKMLERNRNKMKKRKKRSQ